MKHCPLVWILEFCVKRNEWTGIKLGCFLCLLLFLCPTDPAAFPVPGEASLTDTLALESLIIKTEPIDSSDFQLYGPDASLTASVCTGNMEMVYPGTSAPVDAGIPDGMVWDSAQSYMAPLDFDPTLSTMARNRSQRRSFACPDCGKVFGREQRLMFHMRVHSDERPYTYRRRKTCFYGDKKRKKKLRGLSKVYASLKASVCALMLMFKSMMKCSRSHCQHDIKNFFVLIFGNNKPTTNVKEALANS